MATPGAFGELLRTLLRDRGLSHAGLARRIRGEDLEHRRTAGRASPAVKSTLQADGKAVAKWIRRSAPPAEAETRELLLDALDLDGAERRELFMAILDTDVRGSREFYLREVARGARDDAAAQVRVAEHAMKELRGELVESQVRAVQAEVELRRIRDVLDAEPAGEERRLVALVRAIDERRRTEHGGGADPLPEPGEVAVRRMLEHLFPCDAQRRPCQERQPGDVLLDAFELLEGKVAMGSPRSFAEALGAMGRPVLAVGNAAARWREREEDARDAAHRVVVALEEALTEADRRGGAGG